jgi:hypothetical protein
MADKLTIEGRYQLIFTGYPVYGTDLAKVRKNFEQKFQLPTEKIEALFSGTNILVQKDLSWAEAQRYQEYMKELGALCEIVPANEDNVEAEIESRLPCPECREPQAGDICTNCGFDIRAHRLSMEAKGFVEIAGTGYVKERRQGERRSGTDRREGVRFEAGRRQGSDRRTNKNPWRDRYVSL